MHKIDLREYKKKLDKGGRIISIKKEVDPVHEMAAVLKKVNGEKGMYFEKIKGYKTPVISGLCGSREDWMDFFGVTSSLDIRARIKEALLNPIDWVEVEEGTSQEVEIDPVEDLLEFLPVPKFSEKDSGHFITAGIVMSRMSNGNIHSSVRRLQINKGSISVLIESPGLMQEYLNAEKAGKDMEIAVVLGVHPLIILASQISGELFPVDKIAVAGALMGEAVPMVKCKSIDLPVPAYAEIIIEGKMISIERQTEGPFGELAGYYGPASKQPVMKINKITHRKNPWFQVIAPGSTEHKLCGAFMREMMLFDNVKQVVGVKDVHVTMAGSGRFHAIVGIKKQFEGEGKTAIIAALGSNKDFKHVVIVNDDVDIYDPADIEWAISSRVQASEDIIVIGGARGSGLEPSHNIRGITDKMGIDATYPLAHAKSFERIKIPAYEDICLADYTK